VKVVFSDDALDDYLHWQGFSDNGRMLERVNALIKETRRDFFKGLGKPEPLKGDLAGWWSRRISDEHRMVYRVSGGGDTQQIEIAQLRYHY
jgi:toxin YoeB